MFKMLMQEGTTHCGKAVFKRVNVIVIVYILFHICSDSMHAHLESGGEQITLVNIVRLSDDSQHHYYIRK